jgi:hypothetical protein
MLYSKRWNDEKLDSQGQFNAGDFNGASLSRVITRDFC